MFSTKQMFMCFIPMCLAQGCIPCRIPTVLNCVGRSKMKLESLKGDSLDDSVNTYSVNKYKLGKLNGLHFSYDLRSSVGLDGALFLREVGHYRMGAKSGLWIYYTGNGYYNRWIYYLGSIVINGKPKTPKNSIHTVEGINCK